MKDGGGIERWREGIGGGEGDEGGGAGRNLRRGEGQVLREEE